MTPLRLRRLPAAARAVAAAVALALCAAVGCDSAHPGRPAAGPAASRPAAPSPGLPSPSPPRTTVSPLPSGGLGGTLHIAAQRLPGLDPATAAGTSAYQLLRMVARSLYAFPVSEDVRVASQPVPDLAARPPAVSADGLTYTFSIRAGVSWDVPGGRQVTSQDVARGLKRLCNPVAPSPLRTFYTDAITGLATFCAHFADVPRTAASVARYLERTPVSGLRSVDDHTLAVTLRRPAGDLLDLLALPAAAAAPRELLADLPGSPAVTTDLVSDGPYRVVSAVPGRSLELTRNESWDAGSDPVRHAYADHVAVTSGPTSAQVQRALETGAADLSLDTAVPAARAAALVRADDPRLFAVAGTSTLLLLPNLHRPALRSPAARRALQVCVPRSAVAALLTAVVAPSAAAVGVLPPLVTGYTGRSLDGSPSGATTTARCRRAFVAARVRRLAVLDPGPGPATQVLAVLRRALAADGVASTVVRVPAAGRSSAATRTAPLTLTDPATAGTGWDVALDLASPAWPGLAGRSLAPLLAGTRAPAVTRDPRVDAPLAAALALPPAGNPAVGPSPAASSTPMPPSPGGAATSGSSGPDAPVAPAGGAAAAAAWAAVDAQVLRDDVRLPLATLGVTLFHSRRVGAVAYQPLLGGADPTNVFLAGS